MDPRTFFSPVTHQHDHHPATFNNPGDNMKKFQSAPISSPRSSLSSISFPATPDRDDRDARDARDVRAISFAHPPEPKKLLDISNLMSPPELPLLEHFSQGIGMQPAPVPMEKPSVPSAPLSPPISPFTKGGNSIERANSVAASSRDPILYPGGDVCSSPPRPLFGVDQSLMETQRAVDEHMARRSPTLFREASPPHREDYELALYFKSEMMKTFVKNRRGWLEKQRELLLADRKTGAAKAKSSQLFLAAKPVVATRPAAPRVTKPEKAKRTIRQGPLRLAPQSTSAPRQPSMRIPSATPEPRSKHVPPNREDKDFDQRPDYCPPLGDLPAKPNSLKVDWKGNPLDLSKDPNRHLLHPDELILAGLLRLDCATYLTSKRRIFERRLQCAKIGKEFRKTDAQQACKIDVNKASKLWMAYDKVGWLDMRHMLPYMKSTN